LGEGADPTMNNIISNFLKQAHGSPDLPFSWNNLSFQKAIQ
jgi:hypothetical protein